MAVLQTGTKLKHGTFEIVSLLGSGGFGEVYLGRQARVERDVAIKVLHPHIGANADMVVRFQREAFAAANLMHPNVLTVFDFDYDEDAGAWFLAMQYVPGGRTLREVLGVPRSVAEAVYYIEGVASALDAAHARGIIHRDVKPENVMLDGNRALLTDFGIAHLTTMSSMTAIGLTIGTPAYMSPEQAMGRTIGARSDQYALGVMIYEMLAGRLPFIGEPVSLMIQHTSSEPPPLEGFNPEIVPSARAAVARAMSKNPEDRFPSCTAFVDVLRIAVLESASRRGAYVAPAPPEPTREAEPAQPFYEAPAQPGPASAAAPDAELPPPADRTIMRPRPTAAEPPHPAEAIAEPVAEPAPEPMPEAGLTVLRPSPATPPPEASAPPESAEISPPTVMRPLPARAEPEPGGAEEAGGPVEAGAGMGAESAVDPATPASTSAQAAPVTPSEAEPTPEVETPAGLARPDAPAGDRAVPPALETVQRAQTPAPGPPAQPEELPPPADATRLRPATGDVGAAPAPRPSESAAAEAAAPAAAAAAGAGPPEPAPVELGTAPRESSSRPMAGAEGPASVTAPPPTLEPLANEPTAAPAAASTAPPVVTPPPSSVPAPPPSAPPDGAGAGRPGLPVFIGAGAALLVGLIALALIGRAILGARDGAGQMDQQPSIASPAGQAAVPPAAPTPTSAPARGTVRVASAPEGASIIVNGEPAGRAPRVLTLGPGEYTLTVAAPSYEDWTQEISVAEGSDVVIEANLAPLPALKALEIGPARIGRDAYLDPSGTIRLGTLSDKFTLADEINAIVYLKPRSYGIRDLTFHATTRWQRPGGAAPIELQADQQVSRDWEETFVRACAPAAAIDPRGSNTPLSVEILIDGESVAQLSFSIGPGNPAAAPANPCDPGRLPSRLASETGYRG